MSKHAHLNLAAHFDVFVETQVAGGKFDTASDVLRAGLQLLEEQDIRLATLRQALIEGENSGPSTSFDVETFLADKRRSAALG